MNRTGDDGLGDVVTEAFRVDLIQSKALTVVDRAYVAEILDRMERESRPGRAVDAGRPSGLVEDPS